MQYYNIYQLEQDKDDDIGYRLIYVDNEDNNNNRHFHQKYYLLKKERKLRNMIIRLIKVSRSMIPEFYHDFHPKVK